MNVLDAFHQTVHSFAGGCESLAVRIGMSAGVLRNKANPNSATNKPTLDEVDRVLGVTEDYRVLHALAQNHGFVCVKMEESATASDVAVLEMVTRVMSTNGEVGAELSSALADGRITRVELERIRAAVKRAEAALEGVVSRMEGMAER
jgi:hypothetical protein